MESANTCPICLRSMDNAKRVSKHHLIPKSKGGTHQGTVLLHNICHQKIHSVFTEKELKTEYHTVEKLREHPEMKKFIKWVAKKEVDFYDSNKRMKR